MTTWTLHTISNFYSEAPQRCAITRDEDGNFAFWQGEWWACRSDWYTDSDNLELKNRFLSKSYKSKWSPFEFGGSGGDLIGDFHQTNNYLFVNEDHPGVIEFDALDQIETISSLEELVTKLSEINIDLDSQGKFCDEDGKKISLDDAKLCNFEGVVWISAPLLPTVMCDYSFVQNGKLRWVAMAQYFDWNHLPYSVEFRCENGDYLEMKEGKIFKNDKDVSSEKEFSELSEFMLPLNKEDPVSSPSWDNVGLEADYVNFILFDQFLESGELDERWEI